jgi:hypothetical protein
MKDHFKAFNLTVKVFCICARCAELHQQDFTRAIIGGENLNLLALSYLTEDYEDLVSILNQREEGRQLLDQLVQVVVEMASLNMKMSATMN